MNAASNAIRMEKSSKFAMVGDTPRYKAKLKLRGEVLSFSLEPG